MFRILQFAVLWLLAAALPIQTLAAATMVACGPSHHRMAGASEHGHHEHVDVLSLSTVETHQARAILFQATVADPVKASQQDEHGSLIEVAKFKCSACAACCTAAVIPAHSIVFASVTPTEFFAPLELSGLAAFSTEGPERPPRSVLA